MHALLIALVVSSNPFPLPMVDGKAPAVTEGQKHFRMPMRFEKLRDFYAREFPASEAGVKVTPSTSKDGVREIVIVSSRKSDAWKKAIVKEGTMETVIDVTPILELKEENVIGTRPTPLVQFVVGRSPEVDKALNSIDHTEDLRK